MDRFTVRLSRSLLAVTTLLTLVLSSVPVRAQKQSVYTPITLTTDKEVADNLTEKDIPTGDGGFARDYVVQLNAGDQVAIDLTSDNFDSMVTLMSADGATIGQNDDGPDGSNNSLLFARIKETGTYIVRVRAFGETGSGAFKLKLSKLRTTK